MKELSSWDWSERTILGCLGTSEFWTISDWTELGLVELSLTGFLSAVTSFAWVFIFAAWHVYGFYAQKPLWSVLQFCEGLCMHWQLDLDWVCGLPQVCIILFCLGHWSLVDHILPVKMCGTHLGVVVSAIFGGSVNHLLRCASRTLGWIRESLCLAWHEMAEL